MVIAAPNTTTIDVASFHNTTNLATVQGGAIYLTSILSVFRIA